MITAIRDFLKSKKKTFNRLCSVNNIKLDYKINRNEFGILKSIFQLREYSDYFPFYQDVNIVDIGAHYGYFSIFANKNSGSKSKIISIEPNKNNFSCLSANIKLNEIQNINSYNLAVGAKNEKTKLYFGKNTNHSIIENYKLSSNSNFEEIELKTLESIINENNLNEIHFLKMDCEGAEYEIFETTPPYIFDKITTISMEFHDLKDKSKTPEQLIKKLLDNNFQVVKYIFQNTSMNLNYGKIIGTKVLNRK